MEIPKVIHYCWFGGKPLPKLGIKCIESWRKFFPDYEIKRWDESNFDVDAIAYTKESYAAKKYAFVSDYARFWILYKYGGLYFDTDVEVIRPMDEIIARGSFMGCEQPAEIGALPQKLGVAPGLGLGVTPGLELYKEILELYSSLHFILDDGSYNYTTVVRYVTDLLCEKGLKNLPEIQYIRGVYIYPADYFCPISTIDGKLRLTPNTRSVHWYEQSWQSPLLKYGRKLVLFLGGPKLKRIIKTIFLSKRKTVSDF